MKKKIIFLIFVFLIFIVGMSEVYGFNATVHFHFMDKGTDYGRTAYPGDYTVSNGVVYFSYYEWQQVYVLNPGRTFSGWYLDSARTISSNFSYPAMTSEMSSVTISESDLDSYYYRYGSGGVLDVYAKWVCSSEPYNFRVYYGNSYRTVNVNQSNTDTIPALSSNSNGERFLGWYYNGTKVTTFADTVPIAKSLANYDGNGCITSYPNVYLTAKYEETYYTITISPNGGSYNGTTSNTTVSRKEGQTYTVLEPQRNDYLFDGWNVTPSGVYNSSTNVITVGKSNVTLTANWIEKYHTLTIDPDGGTYEGESNPDPKQVEQGNSYSISDPVRDNYVFTGWSATPSTAYNSSTKKVTVNGTDITLKANWERITHKLTINPDGGLYEGKANPDTITVEQGNSYSISDPVRDNYVFTGWTVTPSGGYNSSSKMLTIGTSDITLKANWERITHKLTINPDGGLYEGKTNPDPIKLTIGTSDISLKANWQVITHILRIDPNGGTYNGKTNPEPVTVEQGVQIEPLIPIKDGYDFDGWTTNPTGLYNKTTNKLSIGDSDVNIVAKWINKVCPSYNSGQYILEFETNGGNEISLVVVNFPNGENAQLPKPTKKGYIFGGWYFDRELTKKVDATTTMVTTTPTPVIVDYCPNGNFENITIYAKWNIDESQIIDKKNYGDIYFNSNGGTTIDKVYQGIIESNPLAELVSPKKDGYIFRGWYYDKELTKVVKSSYIKDLDLSSTSTLNGLERTINYQDLTLYAKWITKSEYCGPITNKTLKFEKINYASVINGVKKYHIFDDFIEVSYPFNESEKEIIKRELFTYSPIVINYINGGATHNIDYTPNTFVDSNYSNEIKYEDLLLLEPEYEYNDEGCEIGYKIKKLYQKSELTCVNGSLFKVSFVTNGGNGIDEIIVSDVAGNWQNELPIPTKNDSEFVGWYYDAELTKPVSVTKYESLEYSNEKKYDNVGCQDGWADKKLYAKWKAKNPNTGMFVMGTIIGLISLLGILFIIRSGFNRKIYKI